MASKIKLSRSSFVGIVVFFAFFLIALLSPFISPYDPWKRFEPFERPSIEHILGTNDIGNDILSEVIYGTRVSLIVGCSAAIIATIIGTMAGTLSGYFKGAVDEVVMGITDIFLMIPQIPLIIILAAFLKPSFGITAVIMGFLWWPSTARVVRSKVLQVREMSYVESARSLGFSDLHIMITDIIPNFIHVLIPKFLLVISSAMIAEASLSFLGLGDPTTKSWGTIINFAFTRGGFDNDMWWWYLPPGFCITIFVLSAVLLGQSIEDQEEIMERIE